MANRSKYGVDLTEKGRAKRTYAGIRFRSLLEKDCAVELDRRKAHGEIESWSYEDRRIALRVNDSLICTYVPDFSVTLPGGRVTIVEVKGRRTADWRIKEKLFRATWLREHPEVGFEVVSRLDAFPSLHAG